MAEFYHPMGEEGGILILDYFAAEAMKAFIINGVSLPNYNISGGEESNRILSVASYELATKMMDVRKDYIIEE